ncbi:MAG: FHA domain-containing protein [Deltaproteobacteria bacterium]|nr:FHA domain-containing protein [Deltaproteobacteria bacterium]
MAYLQLIGELGNGRIVSLESDVFFVGRDRECDLSMPDGRISRRHARLQCHQGEWRVEDLNSKNGIAVNGKKVGTARIRPGDAISIGPLVLEFHNETLTSQMSSVMDKNEVTRVMSGVFSPRENGQTVKLLLDIAAALDSFESFEDVLTRFRELVVQLFEPEFCLIRVEGEEVVHRARHAVGAQHSSRDIGDDALARILDRGEAFVASDVSHEPEPDELRSATFLGIRSVMGAPILIENEAAGLLYLERKGIVDYGYGDEELHMLIGVSRLIGAAMVGAKNLVRLDAENRILSASRGRAGIILGESTATRSIRELIEKKIGPVKATVLVMGETGTGKGLVAEAIHLSSPRRKGPLVKVNCAAIPRELMESELFGYEKGAFSGANKRKAGLFEAAAGGTLFLDEIGELDASAQAKLLAVLQDRQVQRVGSTKPFEVDVRIIAATNRDPGREVEANRFRGDLYYRLNVVSLQIPPLRDRPEDIPYLARHFLKRACRDVGRRILEIDSDAMELLMHYSWPGNVRELANCMERAVIFGDDGVPLKKEALPRELQDDIARPRKPSREITTHANEKEMVAEALARAKGNKREAARILGWYPQKLYSRLKRYGFI